jgi:hypothetical protein
MTNPNYQVTWLPRRPDLVIQCLHGRGTSTSRGYHESYFEVVSSRKLEPEDFARLDACGLLGLGQAYDVIRSEAIEDKVPAVVLDKRTGQKAECDCNGSIAIGHKATCATIPRNYRGEPYTATNVYEYWRYEVRRICDSGD